MSPTHTLLGAHRQRAAGGQANQVDTHTQKSIQRNEKFEFPGER